MEKAVVGATKPKCMYPKQKYIDSRFPPLLLFSSHPLGRGIAVGQAETFGMHGNAPLSRTTMDEEGRPKKKSFQEDALPDTDALSFSLSFSLATSSVALLFGATTSMHNIMLIMNALQPRLSSNTWTVCPFYSLGRSRLCFFCFSSLYTATGQRKSRFLILTFPHVHPHSQNPLLLSTFYVVFYNWVQLICIIDLVQVTPGYPPSYSVRRRKRCSQFLCFSARHPFCRLQGWCQQ